MKITSFLAILLVAYEIIAWLTRNRRREMSSGDYWLRREAKQGARWNGHEDVR